MKFIVAVDCEGVACAVGSAGGSLSGSQNFDMARRQATREADAAARGLFDAGAEQVIVWDNHGGSLNLDYDALDERCDIALGTGFAHRWPGLDAGFNGVLLVGYHAMDNSGNGVLCHSFSSATYQYMKINGCEVGEVEIDAAMAGEQGVPLLFVAGDHQCVAEAQRFFPGIQTVTTKIAHGWNAAVSKHPRRAVQEIRQGAERVARRCGEVAPFTFAAPVQFEIRYKRLDAAQAASRGFRRGVRVDPYTVRWELSRLSDWF